VPAHHPAPLCTRDADRRVRKRPFAPSATLHADRLERALPQSVNERSEAEAEGRSSRSQHHARAPNPFVYTAPEHRTRAPHPSRPPRYRIPASPCQQFRTPPIDDVPAHHPRHLPAPLCTRDADRRVRKRPVAPSATLHADRLERALPQSVNERSEAKAAGRSNRSQHHARAPNPFVYTAPEHRTRAPHPSRPPRYRIPASPCQQFRTPPIDDVPAHHPRHLPAPLCTRDADRRVRKRPVAPSATLHADRLERALPQSVNERSEAKAAGRSNRSQHHARAPNPFVYTDPAVRSSPDRPAHLRPERTDARAPLFPSPDKLSKTDS